MPASNTIDSNSTGLAYAEELTPKVLPGSPTWFGLEPNGYDDFGGEITTVAREPISANRQNKRGTTTDLDASGGFGLDFVQRDLARLLQGFFFRDALEKISTKPLNTAQSPITSVDVLNGQYNASGGMPVFVIDRIFFASGFDDAANNGIGIVTAVNANDIETDKTTVADAAPNADAIVESVGHEFATGDLELTVSGGLATFTSAAVDMTTLELNVGEWIFVGGDLSANQFPDGTGYFRISEITATTIVCDKAEDLKITSSGTGKEIRIFFGTYLKNASDPANIVCRTYQLERTLGNDGSGVQSEYLTGSYANEFNLAFATATKLESSMSFVALDNEQRDGTTGVKSGTRVASNGDDAYNTSSDVRRQLMNVIDSATLNPTALFAFLSEFNININNNVSPVKAIATLGAISVALGNFVVSGSLTAYFTTVAATQAVRNNADVTIDAIIAKKNAGWAFDIPLLGLGGGKANVEKDSPITIPLENFAAENDNGYTMSFTQFQYLPTVAMPTA
ncbi:hypothetical protein COB55_04915 [Candidatus Wolfebacteria bacterium]|nr:MAG: hypothetical protein COB55_04915 [Candidatus Wolfebacteria bacterium]